MFEPSQDKILKDLVPKILKTQFFRYLLDSNASEHGARMTAMDKATENANELLKSLNIMYNRARQAAITTELTEFCIVSWCGSAEQWLSKIDSLS
jgi:F-type H+-transporting ATPase subunit gamma